MQCKICGGNGGKTCGASDITICYKCCRSNIYHALYIISAISAGAYLASILWF